ncbi:Cytoplasmic tRNA 2-thiolation protein 1 [Hibiscus syriacus]|uniref:Cytoplasmic tRNA 2-thiolation protein 1 n=1 Tax=Hibiscus syriacus TaxID=106335 RepID=A0A6A3A098_HIBSY|nr:Cytoplasmic tRNA 2-thiolation protein 1 [Hibiscus syriacus]
MEYDLIEKFTEIGGYIARNKHSMHDRTPPIWCNPVLPKRRFCGQENSAKLVISAKKRAINWLFLLLGQMVGCCTLEHPKYFCKHTNLHRTAAKDRVIYLAYLCLRKRRDEMSKLGQPGQAPRSCCSCSCIRSVPNNLVMKYKCLTIPVLVYVLSVLNRQHNYGLDLFLSSIDEGITGYRDDSLETVKRNELQALDRGAALLKVDKVSTGYNADDIAETVLLNILRVDIARLSRCTSIITGEEPIARCKPFKYTYEKKIVIYP